jgi:hypothetical protein
MSAVASVFLSLKARERARVALAVLLDGGDAPLYLLNDERRGADLRRAAEELLAMELDVRFPYVGTMLRLALEEEA